MLHASLSAIRQEQEGGERKMCGGVTHSLAGESVITCLAAVPVLMIVFCFGREHGFLVMAVCPRSAEETF